MLKLVVITALMSVVTEAQAGSLLGRALGFHHGFPFQGPKIILSDLAKIRQAGSHQYSNGEKGFGEKNVHNSGRREFHDIGQHHSKVTQITTSENSESHNIGGSEEFNNGAVSRGAFTRHNNGASRFGNDFSRGASALATA
ncbi:unnamed protein product [Leptosia nina]|uniref:Uncharacterized protein n=1 Tax=Leptosia nina TaxID=320188 RepID=A0AAV1JFG7_9NEOP